ncbi:mediator of DNA damage checkpoint protein 1 [Oncorhynchus keta]|uniref:mediator of DNA damage checkpoint protein 1 n=1 Tax=Oncorhynchus keta TaxID=8018 RepID=UPI00227AB9AD|nr:mediator of DNA damage checkpoint protein 1 [Oncorhynchus keta]XP_052345692.1 mediator of DNA damage checkpoint protein 1 [Oncorhynchus keta]
MEATQLIDDSVLEESEEEEDGAMRGEPLAKLRVLKNKHITETELPLYQGENVLGRNPDSCSLPLVARSVSKQHTIISISMFRGNRRHGNVAAMETEALVWDLGSMNGTRKGRTKLTPHVRYALTEGECVVIADIPCQYVSVDQRGGQGHMQNPTNAHSGRGRRSGPDRKAQLRGSPSGQGLGRETGTPKTEGRGVNGEIGAPSLTELGGKGQNLAKPLSFEQTPTQPERTLVPESDSDGEREGRRDKRGKYFVSDSDSHMSSPTCSTFLSPTNKVIPESEDESPITPSSSAKNRPKKIVSFSEEESDMDGPRQQPRRRRAQVIVDDSEEEEEEEGTEALGEKEPGKRTRGKEDVSVVNQVSQAERDRLTPSAPMVSTEDTFNMDSDTDVEGEEEMGLSAPVNAVKPPAATEPPTTDSDPGQIHMDSDTDVEEGDTMDGDSKLMLTAADVEKKPVDSVPVVQPTEIHLDSDTDVDDDDVVVSDSATNVTSFISDPAEKPDDPAPAVPPVEFHPDTDTDVEEEDTDTHSKTVPESDSSGIRTGIAAPQEILLDSDTDEEDSPFTPPASSRTAELLNPPTSVGPAAAAPLEIRSDSDTDLEEDATQTMNLPPNVTTVTEDAMLASRQAVLPSPTITTTTGAVTKTFALRSQDSDADTDAEEERLETKPPRCRPPAGMVPESDLSEPSDFMVDSDTEEDGPGKAGQGQTACRLREGAAGPGLLPLGGSPGPHQMCSTPLASSVQEEMETQAFFCPSDPFRRPALPPVLSSTAALSCSASDSLEDDDFVVAETQSFVLEAQNQGHQSSLPVEPTLDATQPYGLEPSLGEEREVQPSRGSFQLGLSDSSHLQARDQASESTQAFSFPDGDSDLEATQTYGSGGGREEPGLGQRSAVFRRNRQVDFVLEATQAYAAQPRSDTEEKDEETQPLEFPTPSNVATTETLPMSAYEEEDGEEEEDLVGAKPLTPVRRGRSGGAREREEEEQETQTGEVLTNQYLSTAQTLDIVQESDDEEEAKPDSPRRRRTQKQTVDEEETQTVGSYLSTAETQPMFTAAAAEDDDNEEEELKPPSPRRRGMSQRGRVEEEETQPSEFLTSSHISTAETQPMATCDTEEEEAEDTKAKGQAQRERGKESEPGTSGFSSRGRRGARGGEEENSETLKTQMRGKGKAVNTAGGGGRREVLPEEEESEKEEEAEVVEQGRRGRGRKSVKQQKEGEKERLEEEEGIEKERQEQAEKERLQKEQVESERVMKEQQDRESMVQELKEQDERLEREKREETERMEREKREETERMEREKREETERMEREKREETERMEREKREETERMEREKREETERMEREKREQEKREETERMEREKREQEKREETERMEREKREETERMEREKREQEKREETERMEREKREETERMEREKREEEKREETERMEREKREETERMEREKREQEKREETERMEREKREETERMEREKREETERMEREKIEQEKREETERMEREKREETERMERERKEIEERNRLEREEKEKQERLEVENREREALERSERERVEKERIEGEQAEKQRSEKEKMEREEKRKQERELLKKKKEEKERNLKENLESEKKEREKREADDKEKEIKERQAKEQGEKQAKIDNENELKTSRRGRRATTRRTVTVPPTTEPQPELNILSSTPEPVPASITRSRSNSSNSVSSERSSMGSRGRGGRKTTSTTEPAPGPDNPTRNSTRRRTLVGTVVAPPAAVEVTVQDILSSEQFVARRTRSSSTNSHSSTNSEVSTCIVDSVSSKKKGRGGGRRRKTGTESVSPSNRQSEQPPAHKPMARGRRSQKVEDDGPHPVINEKADSQEAGGTTRGQNKTAKTNEPDPVVADEETTPAQVTEDSPAPRGNGRGRGRAGQKDNTPESTTTTAGGDTPSEEGVGSKTGGRGKGRKRGLEEEEEENSGFKVPRRKAKVQRGGRCRAAEEEGEKEEKHASTPANRSRASTAQVKKIAEEEKSMEGQSEEMEEEEAGAVQRKVRGRQSTVQIKKKEEPVLDSNSVVPQTPTGKGRGKRRAPVESSPLARTPRSSSASPLSSLSSPGTLSPARAATQSYKVLFTGVVDEEGGKVVSCLGGSLAKGVADMTHLVTDRVRRTVKFLCAVARGVPVVTTDWLDKCGKVGRFLPTDRYLVKDREQEIKFSFCLEESLRTASTQPLLQGYEVHVTRSVLPEPAQMKDIIVCSGAHFLSKMPSTQKAQARTLVISCGEDWSLCAPALSASLPVLSAEFLLTGILQQRVDLVTHVLSAPKPRAQPGAKGQARGRKRM